MSKTFDVMKTDVGNLAGPDTSTAFATLIGTWLNDKYLDIARRNLWSAMIHFDYTFATVASTASYDLPADFDQEIYVADITDGAYLVRYTENQWWAERGTAYSGGTISGGTATRYIINRQSGKIILDPTPDAVHTIAMPYKIILAPLSVGTDLVEILDIEHIMVLGALAEAMAYKKQFQKASYYLQRYEYELGRRIAQEKNVVNQMYRMKGIDYNHGNEAIRPMTGWGSYDSL